LQECLGGTLYGDAETETLVSKPLKVRIHRAISNSDL
jgi:hypothetical protein